MLFDAANVDVPLVPYQYGVLCARQLREIERRVSDQCPTVSVSPALTPSLSAVPALSSST
jgi:hypothetical protein